MTVQNHASIDYNLTLDFELTDREYQRRYVIFSDEIYTVTPGQHDLEAWIRIRSDTPPINCSMTVEFKRVEATTSPDTGAADFTDGTWNEIDPNNHIDIIGTDHVIFSCHRDEDAYLYKDKGSAYFTDLEHLITVRVNNLDHCDYGTVWALTNDIDDINGLEDQGKTYIQIFFQGSWNSHPPAIYLEEGYGSPYSIQNRHHDIIIGKTYYLKIIKTGTTLLCEIYDDSNRMQLLSSLSLTLGADHSFRYIFACNTYNSEYYLVGNIEIYTVII